MRISNKLIHSSNVDLVNKNIVHTVSTQYKLRILPQPTTAVRECLLYELRLWNDESIMNGDDDVTANQDIVTMLNTRCVRKAARQCVNNYHARVHFLSVQQSTLSPIAHPTHDSMYGLKLDEINTHLA